MPVVINRLFLNNGHEKQTIDSRRVGRGMPLTASANPSIGQTQSDRMARKYLLFIGEEDDIFGLLGVENTIVGAKLKIMAWNRDEFLKC